MSASAVIWTLVLVLAAKVPSPRGYGGAELLDPVVVAREIQRRLHPGPDVHAVLAARHVELDDHRPSLKEILEGNFTMNAER